MNTLQFLNAKFPVAQWENGWVDETLTHYFFSVFGCNTWIEGEFYLFKYEVCVVREWNEIAGECRGLIVNRNHRTNQWCVSAFPLGKFFNRNESESGWLDKSVFSAHCKDFELVEKADGSCILLWYCDPTVIEENYQFCLNRQKEKKLKDTEDLEEKMNFESDDVEIAENEKHLTRREHVYQRKLIKQKVRGKDRNQARAITHAAGWRVSTLGRITPSQEMEDQFWRLLALPPESPLDAALNASTTTAESTTATHSNSDAPSSGVDSNGNGAIGALSRAEKAAQLKGLLDPEYTYIFELCGKMNKVVTVYDNDKLFLISARHLTKPYYSTEQLDSLHVQMRAINVPVHRPLTYRLRDLNIHTLDDCEKFIEEESSKPHIYGQHPEGFVVYLNSQPVAKMKNKSYHNIHQLNTGSILFLRNVAITAFFDDSLDDIYGSLQDCIQRFVVELKAKFLAMVEKMIAIALDLKQRVEAVFEEKRSHGTFEEKVKWSLFSTEVVKMKEELLARDQINLTSYLYSMKDKLMKGQEIREDTVGWVRKNHNFFDAYWKKSDVEEIIQAEKLQEKVIV